MVDGLATRFTLSLPMWLVEMLPALPSRLTTVEEQMALVHRLADRNWREGGGGPFAAIVVDHQSGELVSVGGQVPGSGVAVSFVRR